MLLRTLPIGNLKPAPYNPRKVLKKGSPGYRRLERSLAAFELVQPIVWNEHTGHVVGGHQRVQILKDRGESAVECVIVNLPLEREKALNIALNNSGVGSDWDGDKLTGLLNELAALPDFDATLTGFDARELDALLYRPTESPIEDEPEPGPAVRVTLLIAPDDWDALRPALDAALSGYDIERHVRLPP